MKIEFEDIVYVSDGKIRRADIVVEGEHIAKITDKEEYPHLSSFTPQTLLLPGIIDEHVHTREPGLTQKGDLTTETHAAAAGGVTTIMDMPNVVPQTTTLEALRERQALGAAHSFVNYSFYFGATNTNAALLPQLDPTTVPAVKLFMGSSTGGMLVDRGEALRAVFEQSPLLIMAHCEDSDIITRNMREAQARYGDDPAVIHHAEIRSREACLASSRLAVQLAQETGARLHIAHVTTKEELKTGGGSSITLEVCVPHLLFCDEDYATLGTRIKCNPAIKSAEDREALRQGLMDGRITTIATDHAPHLLTDKEGGCKRAASGMPMVQFSLPAMLGLVEEGVLTIERLVELMCHNPARLFNIERRGFIQEGMKADLVVVSRQPWTLTADRIVSRCGWSPLEGRTFPWQVQQTYCNGRLIYDHGAFAQGNEHAELVRFLSSPKVTAPSLIGRAGGESATIHYKISEVSPYINWLYFFHAWGFPARLAAIAHVHGCDSCRASWLASFPEEDRAKAAEAMQLHKEAVRMLSELESQGFMTHVRFGLFDCNADGDDIIIDNQQSSITLCFLRQQSGDCLCLSDFIRPMNDEGIRDRIGIFAACADEAIEQRYEEGTPDADEYRHLLCQTLADRLAEAAIERAHQAIRKFYWGYAPEEKLSIEELHAERFQGIRPAVGYPSLPDQSLNFDLDRLIDFSSIGIRLTEHGAMLPHASVSGLMISHPDAHYFAIGRIGEDQLLDYASRRGLTPDALRPYLAANLG